MNKIVTKPWGKEVWIELNDVYCYKRIYINAGYKTSLQYHEKKKETNYIISGTAEVWLENEHGIIEKKIMKENDFFNVLPPKKHRVIALTDLILQEVSTPEVDDVIRIEDDTNRVDGRIEGEHKTPAVLILCAGLGSRMAGLTKDINKALLPINNKPIISHIIEKFPKDYEFVLAVGYKSEILKDYLRIAHPEHNFIFVDIKNYDGKDSGPGITALSCKTHLQRPFYISTCDCLIESEIPNLDGNWLGVYPTSYPEKYSTLRVEKEKIVEFENKSSQGFDLAFIGICSIWDYETFWTELEKNMCDGELVSAFQNPSVFNNFKTKTLSWFDTGNLDDYIKTKDYFEDKPLSLNKSNGELTFLVNNKFIKFSPEEKVQRNRAERSIFLSEKIPQSFKWRNNFVYYPWVSGRTLYEIDSFTVYRNFLEEFIQGVKICEFNQEDVLLLKKFYKDKTNQRLELYKDRFGVDYLQKKLFINGKEFMTLEDLYNSINFDCFENNKFHFTFHGDLQFDNILYDGLKFTFVDWRESFADNTSKGDLYYDLAKLYGGCLIPYNKMKNDNFFKIEGGISFLNYDLSISPELEKFKHFYESWILDNGFDLKKIKLITGLIFLNMCPLHDEKFSKLLICKSIELLSDNVK